MKKITEQATKAFYNFEEFKQSNTHTIVKNDSIELYLFNNLIASKQRNTANISFTLAGYNTPTTKERLRGLDVPLYTKKGDVYIKLIDKDILIDINKTYNYNTITQEFYN